MSGKRRRIYLSPPHLGTKELDFVHEAFASNWISPVGPHIDAFETEFARLVGVKHAVALSSGTAAIHLALRHLGLKAGDEVFCSTLTFIGSANPIVYEGARPVFIDSDTRSWNMDPGLLADELGRCAQRGRLPRAVIAVDLYGQCADLEAIEGICRRHGVPLIEDAAEALGATCAGRNAGTFGWAGIFSFNGNKIITTAGGGMLATADQELAEASRFLSRQARDPAPHYQHSRIGFNYRLSNVLAAIGRGQLAVLPDRIAARRRNFELYRKFLGDRPGISFMPEAGFGRATRWLTCILVDSKAFGASPEAIRQHLETLDIESRPLWKPLHLQPVFSGCRAVGGKVSEELFVKGLCLPSGSDLTEGDVRAICEAVLSARTK
ncbi:MAG: aminotransferase class I/II-fold pyridoxal phosphate-dependent enzyme [Elusimicrobia bacterium]|nr:aminotransferase class I/II-fold pyridoxal phosphate-dependent enzyme [Elusimicrobiota bacterium]